MGELHRAPLSSLEPASSIPQRSTESPMSALTIMAPAARGPTSQVAREAVGYTREPLPAKSDAVIIDGGKGLQAAAKKAFRKRALIQRCQWHKRENMVSYLSKGEQASWRKRLQWAYTLTHKGHDFLHVELAKS